MLALLLLSINQNTNFEVPSFTPSEDDWDLKFKSGLRNPTTPLSGDLSSGG